MGFKVVKQIALGAFSVLEDAVVRIEWVGVARPGQIFRQLVETWNGSIVPVDTRLIANNIRRVVISLQVCNPFAEYRLKQGEREGSLLEPPRRDFLQHIAGAQVADEAFWTRALVRALDIGVDGKTFAAWDRN